MNKETIEDTKKKVEEAIKEKDESMLSALECDVRELVDDYQTFAYSYARLFDKIKESFGI